MRDTSFVSDDLVSSLSMVGHFQQRCTVQELKDDRRNSIGEAEVDGWEDIENMKDIPCQSGVPRAGMMGKELNATSSTYHLAQLIVYLDKHYPDITQKNRIILDGKPYNISTLGTAPGNAFTWLAVDRVD